MIIYNYNGPGTTLNVDVNDRSYRLRQVMGEDSLYLYFTSANFIDIKVGSYVDYEGARYYLHKPNNFKKHHTRNYEYSLVLTGDIGSLEKYKVRDVAEKRLKFPLTAKPQQHLQMLVDNLNMRESGWTMGDCIDAPEKLINYNHTNLREALQMIATEFDTEWEVKNKKIHLKKVEYNQANPLALSYGKGNGFKPGIGRTNVDDKTAIEILHVQGGERNISYSKYGSKELLLPKGQTTTYQGRSYIASLDGLSIQRSDKAITSGVEDSIDLTNIYPQREGTVSAVVIANADKHFYDFVDHTIPNDLNYSNCQIEGEKMTVVFQTGMLAGREFDISKYTHSSRKFDIVPAEQDGMTLPNDTFKPALGDKYAVFGIHLPDAYVRNDANRTGASWDMFRDAVKYLYEHETPRFTFTGELDGIWAKKDWLNIGGKIVPGGYVNFSDTNFQPTGSLIRIVGIKDYINNPHSPEIDLSNNVVHSSFSSQMAKVKQNEVVQEELHRQSISYAKRRYRDSIETLGMLEDAFTDKFTNAISPVTVKTMAMLVGEESLQYRFVNNTTSPVEVAHTVAFNPATKILTAQAGIMQHLTLGIETISPTHKASEYKYWNVALFNTPPLTDADKSYYLYIKANKSNTSATFYISEKPISMEEVSGYYHFLVGTLNAESDGDRSYTSLYGYTEILPGRITAKEFVSPNGDMSINLQTGNIRGNFSFSSGKTVEQGIADAVDAIEVGGRNLALNTSETIAVTGTFPASGYVDIMGGKTAIVADKDEYVFSFYAKATVAGSKLRLHFYNPNTTISAVASTGETESKQDGRVRVSLTTEWKKYWVKYKQNGYLTTTTKNWLARLEVSDGTGSVSILAFKVEEGNIPTPYTPAIEDVQADINVAKTNAQNAQTSANNANSAVGSLNTYVDGAFKDGVVSQAEAKAIEKYINSINEVMAKTESSYNKVYTNTYLTGTPKTTLLNTKINLWSKKDALISAINTAIAGGSTTTAQKTAVDNAFSAFNNYMADFTNALEEANKAIQAKLDELSKGYVNELEIGAVNYILNSELKGSSTGWVKNVLISSVTDTNEGVKIARTENVSDIRAVFFQFIPNTFSLNDEVILSAYLRLDSGTLLSSTSFVARFFDSSGANVQDISFGLLNAGVDSTYKRYHRVGKITNENIDFARDVQIILAIPKGVCTIQMRNVQLEKGNKLTDWKPASKDVEAKIQAVDYLRQAMAPGTTTDITGGLVATNVLLMKDTDGTQTGGLSGLADDNIGYWTGGTYADAIASLAKVIFRKDGTGQLAGGLIKFLIDGGLQVGAFDIDSLGTLLIKDENGQDRVMLTKNDIVTLEDVQNASQNQTFNNSSISNSSTGTTQIYATNSIIVTHNNTKLTVNYSATGNINRPTPSPYGSYSSIKIELVRWSDQFVYPVAQWTWSNAEEASKYFTISSTNKVLYVPKGTYRMRITFSHIVQGPTTGFSFSTAIGATSVHAVFDGSKRITEIGQNGVGIIKDAKNFSFFGVENGNYKSVEKISNTAYYDKPGVLLAGRIWNSGNVNIYFGAKARSGSAKVSGTAGEYQVNHNIGHTNYVVTVTPLSNVTMRITAKEATYFRVRSSSTAETQSEFIVVGNNN